MERSSVAAYEALPILKIFVPHSGHVPTVACLPFFIVYGLGSTISTFFLSFKQ